MIGMQHMELTMAQKMRKPASDAGKNGSGGKQFPPEAFEHHDEVSLDKIKELRDEVGIDFDSDEWEVIDGFGEIVRA